MKLPEFPEGTPSLEDLGVTKKESHHWQAIAAVPADTFEAEPDWKPGTKW